MADSVTYTPLLGTPEHLKVKRLSIKNAKTYAVHLEVTDNDTLALETTVEGIVSLIDT